MTNHFTFFESYYEAVKDLDADIKAEYFDVLFMYALHDKVPDSMTTPIVKALFTAIKPNLDKSKARREAGKQGGSKRKQTVSKTKQTVSKTKQTLSDKDKDKDKDKEKNKEKKFNFNLPVKKSFDDLGQEYWDNLEAYILKSGKSHILSYQDFAEGCLAKGYKYKNFSLAYNNWVKNQNTNSQPVKDEKVQLWA